MEGKIVSLKQLFNEDGTHNCYEAIIDFDVAVPPKLILGQVKITQS